MKDDYTRVLVSFYEKNMEKPFTSCERDLFLYLLCVWAKANQVTPFSCSTSQTERDLSIPRKTIMQCRRRLCERGLISFHEGKGKGNNPYYFFSEVTDKVTVEVTDKVTDKVTVTKEEIPPTPPKEENILKLEEKERISKDIPKKENDLNFCLPGFVPIMAEWLEYKRGRKQSYKTEASIRKCYQNLAKLSRNNPAVAQLIVDRSIANNWAGLFELNYNGAKNQKDNDDSGDVIIRSIKL